MDEDKKEQQANIELEKKEVIEGQLESFINADKKATSGMAAATYYPGLENSENGVPQPPSPEPAPLIKITNIPNTEEQKQSRPIIRTYKSDVEETIQNNHISSINIAVAENNRMISQSQSKEAEEKKSKLNKNILIISFVLILAGALVFFVPRLLVQLQYTEKTPPTETVSSEPIITVDLQEKVNVKDINITRVGSTLRERADQSATKLGQIKNIYLTEGNGVEEKLITATRFLQLINASVPSEIQRTLKIPYMFGLYNYNGNQKFLILKVGSYDSAFSGMFSWETSLWQDFKELFGLQLDILISSENSTVDVKKFQDFVFNNKDCRVIKDTTGKIIFLYSIIDQDTIVITTSTDTLRELMSRVSKARIVTQ